MYWIMLHVTKTKTDALSQWLLPPYHSSVNYLLVVRYVKLKMSKYKYVKGCFHSWMIFGASQESAWSLSFKWFWWNHGWQSYDVIISMLINILIQFFHVVISSKRYKQKLKIINIISAITFYIYSQMYIVDTHTLPSPTPVKTDCKN